MSLNGTVKALLQSGKRKGGKTRPPKPKAPPQPAQPPQPAAPLQPEAPMQPAQPSLIQPKQRKGTY